MSEFAARKLLALRIGREFHDLQVTGEFFVVSS